MRRFALLTLTVMLLLNVPARAENDGDCLYTLVDGAGHRLTQRAARMYVGDEYIAGDDRHYQVVSVDDAAQTATAQPVDAAQSAFASARAEPSGGQKLICMYSTHDDGMESKWVGAGIYDVGDSLKAALEKKGIKAEYSHETFLPHDADAYTRSRRTAEEFMKEAPDALIDIHRDAVPAEQYETTVKGHDISQVRLFVGRSNPNAQANRDFAQQLKAQADQSYPGLIKDIYIGRGGYNQELYNHSILLEFGTHEIDKDKAIAATAYMADVLDSVLYGGGARQGRRGASARAGLQGLGWAVLALIAAAVVFAFVATGSSRGTLRKLRRHASEVTGGLMGEGPGESENER